MQHHLVSKLRMGGTTTVLLPYACLVCTGRNLPSGFHLNCTFYQVVSIQPLFSEKASPSLFSFLVFLPIHITGLLLPKHVHVNAPNASLHFLAFPLCYSTFFYYYQLIYISFSIKIFQVSILLLFNYLCNVFFSEYSDLYL